MMSSLSLHAASLSTNNTGLELLQLVSEIYKTWLHWGTKCGHGLCWIQRRGRLTRTNVVVVARVRRMVILSDYRVLLFTMSPCDYLLLVSLPPNTPPQVKASPISEMCFLCFRRGRALVRTSAVCSGSQQLSIVTSPFSTSSLIQCHRIAICLLRLWNCWFL